MSTISQWDQAANSYLDSQEASNHAKKNREIVMKHFSDLKNKKVLDLGCGYGCYTHDFNSIHADVIGVDGSSSMIKLAKEKYPSLQFDVYDIEQPLPYPDNSFDLVFCNQVLMDIKNIASVIQEVQRITKDKGLFYVSITHPAFYDGEWLCDENGYKSAKVMKNYLSEINYDNEFWGKTKHYHRPLSTYLNLFCDHHFRLVHMEEPHIYDNTKQSSEIPLFIMMEFEKLK